MTTEEFKGYWDNKGLREYIINQAKRRSKKWWLQEDYVQEAWLAISCAPADSSVDFLKDIAYKAIYSGYWKWNKVRLLQNAHPPLARAQKRIIWDKRRQMYVEKKRDEY